MRCILELEIEFPYMGKDLIARYLSKMEIGKEYNVYTLYHDLSIIKCVGFILNPIQRRVSSPIHPTERLFVRFINGEVVNQWFTFSLDEVREIQSYYLRKWKHIVQQELMRLESSELQDPTI